MIISGIIVSNTNFVYASSINVSNFDELKNAISVGGEINVTGDIDITETLNITKNVILKSNGRTLKLTKIVDSMFFVNQDDVNINFENINLDGNNKGRLIDSMNSGVINIKNSVIKNGTTENYQPKIESENGNYINKQRYQGGAIYLSTTTLNLENVEFISNSTKDQFPKQLILDAVSLNGHGGAIYSSHSNINIKGGKFLNNKVGDVIGREGNNGEGGAIKLEAGSVLNINDESTTKKDTTIFEGNHVYDIWNNGGRQGGAIECTNSVAKIYGTTFKITKKSANTGGAIKFEMAGKSDNHNIIKNSEFIVSEGLKDFAVAGGAITTESSYLTIEDSAFTTGIGSYTSECGGLIQVVGEGEFNLKNSVLNGSGVGWNSNWKYKTTKAGGAICYYNNSTVKSLIENTIIQNFTADVMGAGISISNRYIPNDEDKKAPINLILRNTKLLNNVTYTASNTNYGGGMYIGKDANVLIEGGNITSSVYSATAGAIYNEGNLTITGGANISNNKAYWSTGGIFNDGYLKVDEATILNNVRGDWSTGNKHILSLEGKDEMGGTNIYARKDVIITPNAKISNGDVRVIDKQSRILLTGTLNKKIDVSVSENEKTTDANNMAKKVIEPVHRYVGYTVAEGIDGYKANDDDAKFLHYVTKDPTQATCDFADQISVGKWDYVLNPVLKTVVLGQRARIVYHSNGSADRQAGFDNKKDNGIKDQLYTIYSSKIPWSTPEQMTVINDEPTREGYKFVNWYYNLPSTNENAAVSEKADIQELKGKTKVALFDKTQKFTKNTDDKGIVNIVTPYIINTYAGWTKTIELEITKEWQDKEGNILTSVPSDVTVDIMNGNTKVESVTLTSKELTKKVILPKYDQNVEIKYTVKEQGEDNNVVNIANKKYLIDYTQPELGDEQVAKVVNKVIELKTTNVKVKKVWENVEKDFVKPEIKVWLVKDGKRTDKFVKLNEANKWTATFENLELQKDLLSKKVFEYKVEEDGAVNGKIKLQQKWFNVKVEGSQKEGYTITNSKTKEWTAASKKAIVNTKTLPKTGEISYLTEMYAILMILLGSLLLSYFKKNNN